MTGQELLHQAVGNIGISPSNAVSYEETAIPQINTILSQTFNLENINRESKGLPTLAVVPFITTLDDEIDYQPNVLYNVVAFGLGQLIALSDGDLVNSQFCENRFVDGMKSENKAVFVDIIDVYGESDE